VYQQCYCAINTLTQPIKLVGLRICHSLQKITCDPYWQVFDSSRLLATRNLYSETTCANMLPVRYTFGPFRAPSLSKLEGHVPLPSVWLRRLWSQLSSHHICAKKIQQLRQHSKCNLNSNIISLVVSSLLRYTVQDRMKKHTPRWNLPVAHKTPLFVYAQVTAKANDNHQE